MNNSRRKFIGNAGLLLGGAALLPDYLLAQKKHKIIKSIQLYTVRDEMKKDPLATLKSLSSFGYKTVEHANYSNGKFYGYSTKEFKNILNDLGLAMPSGHTVMALSDWDPIAKDFTSSWKRTVEDAAIVGQHYVISPSFDQHLTKNYDDLLPFLDQFNKCGELCKQSGLKFGYHNHDFEFKNELNGMRIYDIILHHTDPLLVTQQLDIGNMYGAGGKAIEIINKYPGRFELMHLKDEIPSSGKGEMNDGFESTILGKGLIPVHKIIELARTKGGTTQFVIEQESYQGKSSLSCADEDLRVLYSWGY